MVWQPNDARSPRSPIASLSPKLPRPATSLPSLLPVLLPLCAPILSAAHAVVTCSLPPPLTGFGSDSSALAIQVGHLACDVRRITLAGVHCRVRSHPAATPPPRSSPTPTMGGLGSYLGERGVRWQWAASTDAHSGELYPNGSLLLPSFLLPSDCAQGCRSGWSELSAPEGTTHLLEGWFEAPITATYHLLVRTDVASELRWSGGAHAEPTETLAPVAPAAPAPPPPPMPPPNSPPQAPCSDSDWASGDREDCRRAAPWSCSNKPYYAGSCPNFYGCHGSASYGCSCLSEFSICHALPRLPLCPLASSPR